ncbi:MAG: 4Fe-4S binding protein, partial [Planctomycetota bacterium]|nr:4Fe-4S binding protein [Planctomycetota bacterium]
MKIAIASGKGGTGKTTIAAALATLAARRGLQTIYVDCDVEAPNGHLLLRPTIERRHPVQRLLPMVDEDLCDHCRACQAACRFGAIVCLPASVRVYPDLCKSCGACVAACPRSAIGETPAAIGRVEAGRAGAVRFVRGVLDIGRPRGIPVIEAAKAGAEPEFDLALLDAPPGASCPMVTVVRDADLVLLVTDATPFGLADLELAAETVQTLGRPAAVVINRCDLGDDRARAFCAARDIPILAELPHRR